MMEVFVDGGVKDLLKLARVLKVVRIPKSAAWETWETSTNRKRGSTQI